MPLFHIETGLAFPMYHSCCRIELQYLPNVRVLQVKFTLDREACTVHGLVTCAIDLIITHAYVPSALLGSSAHLISCDKQGLVGGHWRLNMAGSPTQSRAPGSAMGEHIMTGGATVDENTIQ